MTGLDLSGRRALVVGGGQGIGRASARMLAEAGAAVAVLDIESDRAGAVAEEIGGEGGLAVPIVADVAEPSQAERGVEEARQQLGGLDIVVNIVGASTWTPLLELGTESWERDFDINLKQQFFVARAAARGWVETNAPGVLCVVGSISGEFSAANHGAYGSAKAGLLALVRTAAEEWWPAGIRVNAVVPGAVRTPRIEAAWADGSVPRPDADTLDRLALPEDIAGAILFLVSDLARRITGQALVVDGGATTKFPYASG